jgi:hypothetical protein
MPCSKHPIAIRPDRIEHPKRKLLAFAVLIQMRGELPDSLFQRLRNAVREGRGIVEFLADERSDALLSGVDLFREQVVVGIGVDVQMRVKIGNVDSLRAFAGLHGGEKLYFRAILRAGPA